MMTTHPNRLPFAAFALATTMGFAGTVFAQDGPSVTIYSSADPASFNPQQYIAQQRMGYNPNYVWQVPGFAVVKEQRRIRLIPGFNEIRFTDVAQFIDPTTVSFMDLTDPTGTFVLEQNFEFDLINADKLYEKYIDRDVTLTVTREQGEAQVTGRVLAVNGGMFIIQTAEGIEFVRQGSGQITLPPLPLDGLVTKPTLVWKLQAERAGEHNVRTTYMTSGMTWRSDYNLILNADDTQADLGAWVTLMNLSGIAYQDAKLKLIAGDVQRVQAGRPPAVRRRYDAVEMMAGKSGFEEKAFFEYHMYTLPRRTNILTNSTQQLVLFPTATGVNVEKVLVYYGAENMGGLYSRGGTAYTNRDLRTPENKKVDVYIRFDNEKSNQLGIPLPAGKVRVYKLDDEATGGDGSLEFIGEDLIDHTPRDEEILIKLGQSFDVVGERRATDFRIDVGRREMFETFEIKVRNHKDRPQKVVIKEPLYRWSTWEIVNSSRRFEKMDARTIHFEAMIPADGEAVVTYTVHYTW